MNPNNAIAATVIPTVSRSKLLKCKFTINSVILFNIFKKADNTPQYWKFEGHSLDIEDLVNPYNDKINPIYKNLLTISSFDFSSDLDVNILGHIFETL